MHLGRGGQSSSIFVFELSDETRNPLVLDETASALDLSDHQLSILSVEKAARHAYGTDLLPFRRLELPTTQLPSPDQTRSEGTRDQSSQDGRTRART